MVPFAARQPYPASERRRLRIATCVFFSMAAGGRSDILDVFGSSNNGGSSHGGVAGDGGGGVGWSGRGGDSRGGGGGGGSGDGARREVSNTRPGHGRRRSGGERGEVGIEGGKSKVRSPSKAEEQLNAVLGALLEVGG